MEPIKNIKREVSSLVPYRRVGDTWEFYLQMRGLNAKTNPGVYGFFGGGLEDEESPLEAMYREIMEELEYKPQNPVYFCRFELTRVIMNMFIEEVGSDFETGVVVHEGQYGRFLTADEVRTSTEINESTRFVVHEIVAHLNAK